MLDEAVRLIKRALAPYKDEHFSKERALRAMLEDILFFCAYFNLDFNDILRDARLDFKEDKKLYPGGFDSKELKER